MNDVVIIGPCAAGKSTLSRALRNDGYRVQVVAQEHSGVTRLWARHPTQMVLFLDVDLEQIHRRGRPDFPDWLLEKQRQRLEAGLIAADAYINTVTMSVTDVYTMALELLRERNIAPHVPHRDHEGI